MDRTHARVRSSCRPCRCRTYPSRQTSHARQPSAATPETTRGSIMMRPPVSARSAETACLRSAPGRAPRQSRPGPPHLVPARAGGVRSRHCRRCPERRRGPASLPRRQLERAHQLHLPLCGRLHPHAVRPAPCVHTALVDEEMVAAAVETRNHSYDQGTLRCGADPSSTGGIGGIENAVSALVRCHACPGRGSSNGLARLIARPCASQPPTAVVGASIVLCLFLSCCSAMAWACCRPCCSSHRKLRRRRQRRRRNRDRDRSRERGQESGDRAARRSKRRRPKRRKRHAQRTERGARRTKRRTPRTRHGDGKRDRRRKYDPEQGRPWREEGRTRRVHGPHPGRVQQHPALPPPLPLAQYPHPGPSSAGAPGGQWV